MYESLKSAGGGRWLWASTPEELIRAIADEVPRYVFFLHWSWHVPTAIWSKMECICFHMTDLPYGRGGSPLQNLIKRGHKHTQLSAFRMVQEMDAGPVYAKRFLPLTGRAEDIYLQAGELSQEIIRWIIAAEPEPLPQQGEATDFKRRKPEQSLLPSEGDFTSIYDHIRMLDTPTYPLAFINHGDFRIEFSHAKIDGDQVNARVVIRKNPLEEMSS